VDAVKELKVKDQNDPKAEEATKLVYRREFHGGVLTETTGKYAGMTVSKIKDVLTPTSSKMVSLMSSMSSASSR